MAGVLRAEFEKQLRGVLAHFDPALITKTYRKKDYLDDLTDWETLREAMRQAVQPIMFMLVSETGQEAYRGLGLEPGMFDPVTPAILNYNQARATKIAKDVNDETEKQLRAALSKGVADGLALDELRAVIEDVMGNATTMRAGRIARTEVSRAQSYGDISAWTQSGVVTAKEFYCANDERQCNFCSDQDGRVIGLDETFFAKGDSLEVGGKSLAFNYDDVPAPPLHPNCRCVLLPVRL